MGIVNPVVAVLLLASSGTLLSFRFIFCPGTQITISFPSTHWPFYLSLPPKPPVPKMLQCHVAAPGASGEACSAEGAKLFCSGYDGVLQHVHGAEPDLPWPHWMSAAGGWGGQGYLTEVRRWWYGWKVNTWGLSSLGTCPRSHPTPSFFFFLSIGDVGSMSSSSNEIKTWGPVSQFATCIHVQVEEAMA